MSVEEENSRDPSFHTQDGNGKVFGEPVRYHQTADAAAYHDIIIGWQQRYA